MVDFDTSSVTDSNIGGIDNNTILMLHGDSFDDVSPAHKYIQNEYGTSIIIEESEGLEMLSNPINVLPKFNENIIGGDI